MFNAAKAIENLKTANMNRKNNNLVTKLSKKNPTYLRAADSIFVLTSK